MHPPLLLCNFPPDRCASVHWHAANSNLEPLDRTPPWKTRSDDRQKSCLTIHAATTGGRSLPSEPCLTWLHSLFFRLTTRIENKKQQIHKMEIQAENKEALKTVALGTSKINYLDPRITVAWCKRNEVPIDKVFNKALLVKFLWAMDIEPDFRF